MKCRQCGSDAPANSKFCPECGFKMQRFCNQCSSLVSETASFCGHCGVKLQESQKYSSSSRESVPTEAVSSATESLKGQLPSKNEEGVPTKSRLTDMSFVAVTVSMGTLSEIAENDDVGAGRPSAIVNYVDAMLRKITQKLKDFSNKCSLLHGVGSYIIYVADFNGSGFGALLKEGSESAEIFPSLDLLHNRLSENFEHYIDARIDACLITTYGSQENIAPELADFHENDEAGDFCRSIESGIEIYIRNRDNDFVTYGSWDDEGDIDEGALEDPDDGDWTFVPTFNAALGSIIVSTAV